MQTPKYRRPLNQLQIRTLQLLYKFRFITIPILTTIFGNKSATSVYKSLQVLVEQGYVHKTYESGYRIVGKQAIYCLLPKGIAVLQDSNVLPDKAVAILKKNMKQTQERIDHYVAVASMYTSLKNERGDTGETTTWNATSSSGSSIVIEPAM